MRTFLDRLREEKLLEVEKSMREVSEEKLRNQLPTIPERPSFFNALKRSSGISLISEVKVRAPGRSNIRTLNLSDLISAFEKAGVSAISVLTDEIHFGGSLDYLRQTSCLTALPCLHKEFIVSPYQLVQGRLAGASAALILAYYYSDAELVEVMREALAIGVEPVVECSLEEEVPRVVALNPRVLLLNNRPIASIPENPSETYQVGSIENARSYWQNLPELRKWKAQEGRLLISASCVESVEDIKLLGSMPYDAALVGNAASSAKDPEGFLRSLRG